MILKDLPLNLIRTARLGTSQEDVVVRARLSEERHVMIEAWFSSHGWWIALTPFILGLVVASIDIEAALWATFGVQFFLFSLDYYRSRFNSKVVFPNVISVALICANIGCIILHYVYEEFQSTLIGPIMITSVAMTMALSLVFGRPFTMAFASPNVDESIRNSPAFYRFNQFVTLFWALIMTFAAISAWISLLFPSNSAAQIVLGIAVPFLLPIAGNILTPKLIATLRTRFAAKWTSASASASAASASLASVIASEGTDDTRAPLLSDIRQQVNEIIDSA